MSEPDRTVEDQSFRSAFGPTYSHGYLPSVPMDMLPTMDPWVVIEEQRTAYVRYRSLNDGRRWEVHGTCAWADPFSDGPCMQGQAGEPIGPPEWGLDCPITPELDCSLCVDEGHLRFVELPSMQELGEDPHAPIQAWTEALNAHLVESR